MKLYGSDFYGLILFLIQYNFKSGSDSDVENQCYYAKPEAGSWRQFVKLPDKLSSPTTFVTTTFGKTIKNNNEVLFVVGKA